MHAALFKHLQLQHQVRINEYKCTCGFSRESALSVGTHKSYCQGSALKDKEHKCSYCRFSSRTENGLKVHTSRVHRDIHNAALKEKKVFAWTEAQLEFVAELVIDLKAKKTFKLNMVLAKMMDREEQAIQKMRTKTKYKQIEARVRQRLKEIKEETDIKPKLSDPQLENATIDRPPSSLTSSPGIDFQIENTQCTPQNNHIKIYRKLPHLGNLSIAKNIPLTSKILLESSRIPFIYNNNTPTNHRIQNRRSSVSRTPRILPSKPSVTEPTPIRLIQLSAHNLSYAGKDLQMQTPRQLPEIPLNHPQNALTHIFQTNESNTYSNNTKYRDNAEMGLQDLLQSDQIGDVVRQYFQNEIC